jgi:VWFA-related protein
MKLRSILAFLLLTCLLLTTFAQVPRQTSPPTTQVPNDHDDVVKITTNLVQVDAVVTKDGKYVKDLRAEDFEIFEDGRKQEITSFAYISNLPISSSSSTSSATKPDKSAPPNLIRTPRVEDPRRIIALVVDDLGLSAESMGSVRKQLRKFVNEKLDPNDLVAIIRTGGSVGALQQFTNDRRLIDRALSQVKWNVCSRVGVTVFPPVGRGLTSYFPPCGTTYGSSLQTLRFVVEAMGEMPGRKSMVVFSDSLPAEEQDFTAPDRFGNRYPAPYISNNMNLSFLLRRIAEQAIRSSVVIYTVDSSGLQYTGPTAEDTFTGDARQMAAQMNGVFSQRSDLLFRRREGADLIAKQTGGFFVRNSNDFQLDRIMEEQSGYYLIGYRPTDETFNKTFHHLKAKVNKSGMTLRTRFGFFGVSEEEVARSRRSPADKTTVALLSPFGAQDLNLDLTALFSNETSGSLVRSMVSLDPKDLSFTQNPDGSRQASIQVRTMLFGDNGIIVDQATHTRELKLTANVYEQAMREGILVNFDTYIKKPGPYQMRVAVRDLTTSRIGSASEFIAVPDLNNKQLALSGILMTQESGVAANLELTARHFTSGMNVQFSARIYNAIRDPATQRLQVALQANLYRDGKRVLTGPSLPVDAANQNDLQRLAVSSVLRLPSDLEPGNYYLQLVATDLLSKQKENQAIQWMDFEIVK